MRRTSPPSTDSPSQRRSLRGALGRVGLVAALSIGLVALTPPAHAADVVVSGVVVGTDGEPLPYGWVTLSEAGAANPDDAWLDYVDLDEDGRFSLTAPPDTYDLCGDTDLETGYVQTCQRLTIGSAGVSSIRIVMDRAARVSGTVKDDLGRPVVDGYVDAYQQDEFGNWQQGDSGAPTDSAGRYSLPVSPGTYRLCAAPADRGTVGPGCWGGGSRPETGRDVVVGSSDVTDRDFSLRRGSVVHGRISSTEGTVTDFTGLYVLLYVVDGDGQIGGDEIYDGPVAADGSFAVPAPAGRYAMHYANGYDSAVPVRDGFWTAAGTVHNLGNAQRFTIDAGTVTGGFDAELPLTSGIAGTVTASPETGFEDDYDRTFVLVYPATGPTTSEVARGEALADPAGIQTSSYFVPLPPGRYRVQFRRPFTNHTTWYGGTSASNAQIITVPDRRPVAGIDNKSDTTAAHFMRGRPTISGTATPGNTLTLDPGTWADGTSLSWSWPDGSTGRSYTVRAIDARAEAPVIWVEVTGRRTGYVPRSASALAPLVGAAAPPSPTVTNTARPTISGIAKVGLTLSATGGAWSPTSVTTRHQWLRDGVPVTGATLGRYTLTAADRGRVMSIRVTATDGTSSATADSSPTPAVLAGSISVGAPRATGTHRVGRTITARVPTATPTGTTVTRQWLRNGSPIKNATKVSYRLTRSDARKRVGVRVTWSKAGYTSISKASTARPIKR